MSLPTFQSIKNTLESLTSKLTSQKENSMSTSNTAPLNSASNDPRLKPLTDCLLAGALGDAFGYIIEFDEWGRIQDQHGPEGLLIPSLNKKGQLEASDDTQMTLFAMEGLTRSLSQQKFSIEDLTSFSRDAYLDWFTTQSTRLGNAPLSMRGKLGLNPVLWIRQAPGNTCLSALSKGAFGNTVQRINDSKGCGAVMRAAPWGFLHALMSLDDIWVASCRQGALTHGHSEGFESGAAFSCIIARQLQGQSLEQAATETYDQALAQGALKTAEMISFALTYKDQHLTPPEIIECLGAGWVGEEALSVGLWAALYGQSVMQAIQLGANHSGDSDSTATLAGQLAALRFGLTDDEISLAHKVDLAHFCVPLAKDFLNALNHSLLIQPVAVTPSVSVPPVTSAPKI